MVHSGHSAQRELPAIKPTLDWLLSRGRRWEKTHRQDPQIEIITRNHPGVRRIKLKVYSKWVNRVTFQEHPGKGGHPPPVVLCRRRIRAYWGPANRREQDTFAIALIGRGGLFLLCSAWSYSSINISVKFGFWGTGMGGWAYVISRELAYTAWMKQKMSTCHPNDDDICCLLRTFANEKI